MGGDLTTDRDRSVIDCYGFRRLGSVRCPRGGWGSALVAAMMPPGRIAATVTAGPQIYVFDDAKTRHEEGHPARSKVSLGAVLPG